MHCLDWVYSISHSLKQWMMMVGKGLSLNILLSTHCDKYSKRTPPMHRLRTPPQKGQARTSWMTVGGLGDCPPLTIHKSTTETRTTRTRHAKTEKKDRNVSPNQKHLTAECWNMFWGLQYWEVQVEEVSVKPRGRARNHLHLRQLGFFTIHHDRVAGLESACTNLGGQRIAHEMLFFREGMGNDSCRKKIKA